MNIYLERINKLRSLFDSENIDSLYIDKPQDVAYFTGTKGDDLYLFITLKDAYIITDFRYRELAQSLDWFTYYELGQGRNTYSLISSSDSKRIGVSRNSLVLDIYLSLVDALPGREIVPTGNSEYSIVNQLRIIKDDREIEYTKIAQEISCQAFEHILGFIKPGMTEKQIALELEYYMLSHGADGLSFDTICISGEKTSMPHGVPSDKKVKVGEFITMDYGCTYNMYHSDMTRTIALGSVSDEMKKVYDIVLKAQLNACQNIRAGLTGNECHRLASSIIEQAGYGEYFGHGLGHGTGLEIHEAPRFSPSYSEVIPSNSIVSIEPGIYIPGKFGVRIEDLAVITDNGIINITSAKKELIII